jgi:hypothetical protein
MLNVVHTPASTEVFPHLTDTLTDRRHIAKQATLRLSNRRTNRALVIGSLSLLSQSENWGSGLISYMPLLYSTEYKSKAQFKNIYFRNENIRSC